MIQTENLTHIYASGSSLENTALHDISLQINKGEFLALVGSSGSGKSTLAQHFNGLLLPTSGKVTVSGRDTRDKKFRRQLWRIVGMAFQYPEQQLFGEDVFEDVAFGPRNLGLTPPEVEERTCDALEMVGLNPNEVKKLSPFSLSYGQKRRVALAGVLAVDPEVLVLDEPTAGLDPRGREQLLNVIKELRQRKGKTIVFITHNMDIATSLADRMIVLNEGRICGEGSAREIFTTLGDLKKAGLVMPMPADLLCRLGIKEMSFTLEGAKKLIEDHLTKHSRTKDVICV
jgi:energy-coupling factor transport system ATP-binding protein